MPVSVVDAENPVGDAAALSNEELATRLDGLFRQKAALEGAIVVLLGEVERRQAYRDEGATGPGPWAVERFGVSLATARAYARVGDVAPDLPHLLRALLAGEVSFDKVQALADVATPESDRSLAEVARESSVLELAEVAESTRSALRGDGGPRRTGHDRRSLRCHGAAHVITIRLPAEAYAEATTVLETRAKAVPSDGETPWDQRLCDAFLALVRASVGGRAPATTTPAPSPYVVVVHVALGALVEGEGDSELAGELERDGLISTEVVRRLACDATLVVALDDDVGHTIYEGRARREPTETQRREIARRDRHCRFPGCANATFTNVHHVVGWKPGGRTDLDNLVLLCVHHHHVVHSKGWAVSGNADEELCFAGPSGRAMVSRPSPLWTRVTARV